MATYRIRQSPSGKFTTIDVPDAGGGGPSLASTGHFFIPDFAGVTWTKDDPDGNTPFMAGAGASFNAASTNGSEWTVSDAGSCRVVYSGIPARFVADVTLSMATTDAVEPDAIALSLCLTKNGALIGEFDPDFSNLQTASFSVPDFDPPNKSLKVVRCQGTFDMAPGDTLQPVAQLIGNLVGSLTTDTLSLVITRIGLLP